MKDESLKKILQYQKNEITEHILYGALAKRATPENQKVLKKISEDELRHYNFFKKITGRDVSPSWFKIYFYRFVSRIFGFTFTIKMMDNGELQAEHNYEEFEDKIPGIKKIISDEVKHERVLMEQIEEDVLKHMGSMVLAINNSIQEITGIVVGLTFAIANALMIGKTALISGLAATLAMVASEYLSQKAESGQDSYAAKAALYTGIVYIAVVIFLVSPFFIFSNHYVALLSAIIAVVIILSAFTFFMSVVKGLNYRKALAEVSIITAIVVSLSFMIGIGMKLIFG
ncbi:MAG TPA: VIT1/CCC1 family protein [Spirochaetota bacterium]|jgi:VIT1/CCC1 family predicted Fe2+/Mn2+ transporter|nr:MAG: VIT family protein [Spirochaetes bacterium ADurb.Bin218]HON16204.1 VIT1/CCC1 family protein [Spirochaetota bacterium]HPD78015.1 VIT1/CCC1 family protein [Spirochaetota bacterium]HPP93960.1 VIT1/CCC1 family protein [Spirochaetota bacterium]HRS61716.1 VIT1/CCC1 family protein [Spirochaetota bacterium]